MLEIVFDVVSPGAFAYVKKTGAALKSICKNPLPFVGNLVKAAKLGFMNFAGNFLTHLKKGLIDWLTGSLQGIYIPKALTLIEFGKMAYQHPRCQLGANSRQKIVKALGPEWRADHAGSRSWRLTSSRRWSPVVQRRRGKLSRTSSRA